MRYVSRLAASSPLVAGALVVSQNEPPTEKAKQKPQKQKKAEFLIVGGGTAGFSAARVLKDAAERADVGRIVMVTDEPYAPYMRPPLSKQLWLPDSDPDRVQFKAGDSVKSVFYRDDDFYDSPELELITQTKVVSLDPHEKVVALESGEKISYDKCLLVPGGTPKTLDILSKNESEVVRSRHSVFRSIQDFSRLQTVVQNSQSIAIVGGGYIGCELSIALARNRDKKIIQIIPDSGYMGLVLPKFLSKWVGQQVSKLGVQHREDCRIQSAEPSSDQRQVKLKLTNGDEIEVDHVIVAIGIEPNTELAQSANLEVDEKLGGISVNTELEAYPDVWVAGDAASFFDSKLQLRRRVEHHDHAVVSGRLAANNMLASGSQDKKVQPFWHQSMFWSDLGEDYGYEAIGVIDSKLPVIGYFKRRDGSVYRVESELRSGRVLRSDEFSQGVLFYTDSDRIVGVLLWGIYGKIPAARHTIGQQFSPRDADKLLNNFF